MCDWIAGTAEENKRGLFTDPYPTLFSALAQFVLGHPTKPAALVFPSFQRFTTENLFCVRLLFPCYGLPIRIYLFQGHRVIRGDEMQEYKNIIDAANLVRSARIAVMNAEGDSPAWMKLCHITNLLNEQAKRAMEGVE